MKTPEERLAEREAKANERIQRREAASLRRQEAFAERVRDRMIRQAERQIARTVQRQVNKEHRSTRIPTPAPPVGHKDRFLTKLLGAANPTPVRVAGGTKTKTKAKAPSTHAPAPGTRRVKTRTGWITIKKTRGAITSTMRKSKNRVKRALGELLR